MSGNKGSNQSNHTSSSVNTKELVKESTQSKMAKVINAGSKGIRLVFGQFSRELDPGLRLNLPFIHQVYTVNMRKRSFKIVNQDLLTADGVSIKVGAGGIFSVVDATKVFMKVGDIQNLLNLIETRVSSDLRKYLRSQRFEDVVSNVNDFNATILDGLRPMNEEWGLHFDRVEIMDLLIEDDIRRALAVKAEASQNNAAKIRTAKGDVEASEIYKGEPESMKLRELAILQQLATRNGTVYVVPTNLFKGSTN